MITEELTKCPKCGYEKALTHHSSCNMINWIACPKCRTFFNHKTEELENNLDFWKKVEETTGYKK
jgi:transcription elongation factor Elf1